MSETGAVAGLLTEPPARPKVSRRRSSISVSSQGGVGRPGQPAFGILVIRELAFRVNVRSDSDASKLYAVGGSRSRPRNLEPTQRSSSDVQNSIFPGIEFTTWLTGSPEKLNSVRLSSALDSLPHNILPTTGGPSDLPPRGSFTIARLPRCYRRFGLCRTLGCVHTKRAPDMT